MSSICWRSEAFAGPESLGHQIVHRLGRSRARLCGTCLMPRALAFLLLIILCLLVLLLIFFVSFLDSCVVVLLGQRNRHRLEMLEVIETK